MKKLALFALLFLSACAHKQQAAQSVQQWGAIGGIVRDTAVAQTTTANAAINGVASLGSAALSSMQLTAVAGFASNSQVANSASQALGLGFSTLPDLKPTVTNVAGANLVQGNSNDLSARRDTLTAGTELRYGSPGPFAEYDLVCTAAPAGSAGNGANGGLGGGSSQTCQLVPR